jgi:hypothetical protein
MAYTTIKKPSDYFNTKLYTGDDTNDRQVALDWSPDLTWIKARNVAYGHILFDRIRGLGFSLNSNGTNADRNVGSEFSWSNSGCTTDSFTVDRGSNESLNESGRPMVAWNWLAGGTAVSNTDGSITSSVSANQDAGFSIVSWTGNGADATIGHGLNSAPTIYFVKNRADAADWRVGQVLTSSNNMTDGNGYYMELNDTKASTNPGSVVTWGSPPTAPTSSVFTVGSNNAHNGSSDAMIAYCFHSVQGYSKFGSYTGNGSTDGTFVYLGFKPAFLLVKKSSAGGSDWNLHNNKSPGFNVNNSYLAPNESAAEVTGNTYQIFDLLSNGFKCRGAGTGSNASGETMIYMAFAENPFVTSTGVPATAR